MAISQKRPLNDTSFSANHILMDIEGTTTSISFVKDTLFPYVKKNLSEYLSSHWNEEEFKAVLALLKDQAAEDKKAELEGAVEIPSEGSDEHMQGAIAKNVLWQMESDRKTTALKKLQGHMWRQGYKNGELKGHLFADVVPALRGWVKDGRKLYVYSSGSVEAQKLLFGNSAEGDLLELFSDFFDTEVGAKIDVGSYKAIVAKLKCSADDVLFLTDMPKEASAAREAGLPVVLIEREGNEPITTELRKEFSAVSTFQDLALEATIKKQKVAEENGDKGKSIEENNLVDQSKKTDTPTEIQVEAMDVDGQIEVPPSNSETLPSDKSAAEEGELSDAKVTSDSKVEHEKTDVETTVIPSGDEKANVAEAKDSASLAADDKSAKLESGEETPAVESSTAETIAKNVIEKTEDMEKTVGEESKTKSEILVSEPLKTEKKPELEVKAAGDLVEVKDASDSSLNEAKKESDKQVMKDPEGDGKEAVAEEEKKIEGDSKPTVSEVAIVSDVKTKDSKSTVETEVQETGKVNDKIEESDNKKNEIEKSNGAGDKVSNDESKVDLNGTTNGTSNGITNGKSSGSSNGISPAMEDSEKNGDVENGHTKVTEGGIPEVIVAKSASQIEDSTDAGVAVKA